MKRLPLILIILTAVFSVAQTPPDSAAAWTARAAGDYWVHPDRVYGVANNYQLKLDVWQQHNAKEPLPTVIYIHGGGWIWGDRTGAVPQLLPYLQKGWNAVNVEYRMASVSLAPAAVEDTRCALRWVIQNAKQYNIDPNRLVLTGHSAGGHLSLITGMLAPSAGLDANCPGTEPLKVAAIVNWFGISDVNDLLSGPNYKNYAEMWLGSQTNRAEIARRVSPLTYVRAGLPPVLSIHGDADDVVPYSQATRLHAALEKAGVPNKLITVPGGKHGDFNPAQYEQLYNDIFSFLSKYLSPGRNTNQVEPKR